MEAFIFHLLLQHLKESPQGAIIISTHFIVFVDRHTTGSLQIESTFLVRGHTFNCVNRSYYQNFLSTLTNQLLLFLFIMFMHVSYLSIQTCCFFFYVSTTKTTHNLYILFPLFIYKTFFPLLQQALLEDSFKLIIGEQT